MFADISGLETVGVAFLVSVVAPSVIYFQTARKHKLDRREAEADRLRARVEAKADAAELKAAAAEVAAQAASTAELLKARQDAEDERRVSDDIRADEVAAKVALAADTAAEAAALLVESNKRAQARDRLTMEKLENIERSGDGTLTASMKANLNSLRNLLISEQKLKDERIERGGVATSQTENVLSATEAQIAALEEEIADRDAAALMARPPLANRKEHD